MVVNNVPVISWPELLGLLVIEWGNIENIITTTIRLTRKQEKDQIEFKRRLKQWSIAVATLGTDSPHNIERLSSRLDRLRGPRDHLIHGTFAGCTNTVKYLVHLPNSDTRTLAKQWAIKALPRTVRRSARLSAAADHYVEQSPALEVEYDVADILHMVNSELPEVARQLLMVMHAVNKQQLQSVLSKMRRDP